MCDRLVIGRRVHSLGLRPLCLFVLLSFSAMTFCQDAENATWSKVFLEECQKECAIQKSMITCGRYRAMRWINNVVKEKEHQVFGPLKFIKIPSMRSERFLPEVPRSNKSRMAETMFFIREAAEDLFTRRALMITVDQPSGARSLGSGLMILDDDELQQMRKSRTFDVSGEHHRLFKKKKAIILPVLILLNLLKLKLMLIPIFLGVHFIKKLLVLGSLLLPSILSHLKICKMAHNSYYHHHPWAPPEYAADYPGSYGHEDSWDHRNDVGGGPYNYYYGHGLYNPFSYYFQNYNKQR